jgi:hypothetical protein
VVLAVIAVLLLISVVLRIGMEPAAQPRSLVPLGGHSAAIERVELGRWKCPVGNCAAYLVSAPALTRYALIQPVRLIQVPIVLAEDEHSNFHSLKATW